jgi:hypothetical protein
MDEAAAIEDGDPLEINLTGGEPFLDFDLLCAVLAHGRQLGATLSCVTNAYWARSDEVTTDKLTSVKNAGLSRLAVSVSRFHEQFVPRTRVRRALQTATRLGLLTQIKAAVTRADLASDGILHEWQASLDADTVDLFPIAPFPRTGAALPEADYYRNPGLPNECCPGAIVCIEPDGTAVSCCGPASTSRFLAIGDAHREPLNTIAQRFRTAGIQTILREKGPIEFARAAIAAGLGHLLRDEYAGACDLCMHIGSDPHLRHVAEDLAASGTAV